jgi:acetate kinase
VVFDTAFHSTIPPAARTYALPAKLARKYGYRKYGFHGTSHQYVAQEAAKFLGIPMAELRAVSCHLGSGGASLCAIVNGKSVDNTMGYSPLQGLVMSTRSGDLDPAIALGLVARAQGDSRAVESMLNRRSGLLGLSGVSADIRDLCATGDGAQDETMGRAAQVYLWRIRKYLGAYLLVTERPHCIIFTDTIGEKMPAVRWAVTAGLEALGVVLDPLKNAAGLPLPVDLAAAASRVRILAIATNEEVAIARASFALLANAEGLPS